MLAPKKTAGYGLARVVDLGSTTPDLTTAANRLRVASVMPHAFESVLKAQLDVRGFDMHNPHEGRIRSVGEEHEADDELPTYSVVAP